MRCKKCQSEIKPLEGKETFTYVEIDSKTYCTECVKKMNVVAYIHLVMEDGKFYKCRFPDEKIGLIIGITEKDNNLKYLVKECT